MNGPSIRKALAKERIYHRNANRRGRAVFVPLAPLMTEKCVYCGIEATESRLNGVDRLFNDMHYEEGNVLPACTTCNFMKGKLEPSVFLNQVLRIAVNIDNARREIVMALNQRKEDIYD